MSLDRIIAELEEGWHGLPAVDLCVRILEFMKGMPSDQLRMLTFRELTKASGETDVSSNLLTAIAILRNLSVLDARALFVDFDMKEYEIEPGELAEARLTGEFIHPYTGEAVPDFEKKVIPFFTPSDRFLADANGL